MKGIKAYEPQEESKTDQAESSDKPDQEVKADEGPAITFADYEKLMFQLERQRNFEDIEAQNPKAMEARKRIEQ